MTLNKSLFNIALLCLVFFANTVTARLSSITVVTSFSILEDLVDELGGEHVNVLNLVGRNSDAHMYQPKPSDAVAIANAELVVFNGLEFEGWISRLIENAEYRINNLSPAPGWMRLRLVRRSTLMPGRVFKIFVYILKILLRV